jgi:hypothetical protein
VRAKSASANSNGSFVTANAPETWHNAKVKRRQRIMTSPKWAPRKSTDLRMA